MEKIKEGLTRAKEGLTFFAKGVGAILTLLVPSVIVASLAFCVTYQGIYGIVGGFQVEPEVKEFAAAIPASIPFIIILLVMILVIGELLCRFRQRVRR